HPKINSFSASLGSSPRSQRAVSTGALRKPDTYEVRPNAERDGIIGAGSIRCNVRISDHSAQPWVCLSPPDAGVCQEKPPNFWMRSSIDERVTQRSRALLRWRELPRPHFHKAVRDLAVVSRLSKSWAATENS